MKFCINDSKSKFTWKWNLEYRLSPCNTYHNLTLMKRKFFVLGYYICEKRGSQQLYHKQDLDM
ncbi:hypothetical protein [Bacillus thuringiensis]|uniref:hypothetical protein n=1 Tax=Bacillus thuringiensis TaxID=1428 RepID=UPI001C3EE714|nr:hypothetical protein [Bacillus thuringiensis]